MIFECWNRENYCSDNEVGNQNLLHEHVIVAFECQLHIIFCFQLTNSVISLQALASTCLSTFLQHHGGFATVVRRSHQETTLCIEME